MAVGRGQRLVQRRTAALQKLNWTKPRAARATLWGLKADGHDGAGSS